MPHLRRQIREAIAAELADMPTTGNNIFQSRAYRLDPVRLPAVAVYSVDEASERSTMDGDLDRDLEFVVEAYAKANMDVDDTLDEIADEIEIALGTDVTLDGRTFDLVLRRTEIDFSGEGDKIVGTARLTYAAEYLTYIEPQPIFNREFDEPDVERERYSFDEPDEVVTLRDFSEPNVLAANFTFSEPPELLTEWTFDEPNTILEAWAFDEPDVLLLENTFEVDLGDWASNSPGDTFVSLDAGQMRVESATASDRGAFLALTATNDGWYRQEASLTGGDVNAQARVASTTTGAGAVVDSGPVTPPVMIDQTWQAGTAQLYASLAITAPGFNLWDWYRYYRVDALSGWQPINSPIIRIEAEGLYVENGTGIRSGASVLRAGMAGVWFTCAWTVDAGVARVQAGLAPGTGEYFDFTNMDPGPHSVGTYYGVAGDLYMTLRPRGAGQGDYATYGDLTIEGIAALAGWAPVVPYETQRVEAGRATYTREPGYGEGAVDALKTRYTALSAGWHTVTLDTWGGVAASPASLRFETATLPAYTVDSRTNDGPLYGTVYLAAGAWVDIAIGIAGAAPAADVTQQAKNVRVWREAALDTWEAFSGGTLAVVAGQMQLAERTGADMPSASFPLPTAPRTWWQLAGDLAPVDGNQGRFEASNTADGSDLLSFTQMQGAPGRYQTDAFATMATTYFGVRNNDTAAGTSNLWDNVEVVYFVALDGFEDVDANFINVDIVAEQLHLAATNKNTSAQIEMIFSSDPECYYRVKVDAQTVTAGTAQLVVGSTSGGQDYGYDETTASAELSTPSFCSTGPDIYARLIVDGAPDMAGIFDNLGQYHVVALDGWTAVGGANQTRVTVDSAVVTLENGPGAAGARFSRALVGEVNDWFRLTSAVIAVDATGGNEAMLLASNNADLSAPVATARRGDPGPLDVYFNAPNPTSYVGMGNYQLAPGLTTEYDDLVVYDAAALTGAAVFESAKVTPAPGAVTVENVAGAGALAWAVSIRPGFEYPAEMVVDALDTMSGNTAELIVSENPDLSAPLVTDSTGSPGTVTVRFVPTAETIYVGFGNSQALAGIRSTYSRLTVGGPEIYHP